MKLNESKLIAFLLCMGFSVVLPTNVNGMSKSEMNVTQQGQKLKGTVVDSKGEPIIGATIKLLGTSTGTITDLDGIFSLDMSSRGTLEISYVGYVTQKIQVNPGSNPIKVTLIEDSKIIDEVVVVGYGSVKRSDVTGSVASLDASSITRAYFGE